MEILRTSSYRRMPWKNGGGETTEIAVSPAGAALADFDWRVSMAHVASAGPFSAFAGIDRTLAVIAGAGIVLRLAGRDPVRLTQGATPFAFPGDVSVEADLIDTAIDDLNVMTRRGRYRHAVVRLPLAAPRLLARQGETTLILATKGDIGIKVGSQSFAIGARDALRLDGHDPTDAIIAANGGGEVFVIEVSPVFL